MFALSQTAERGGRRWQTRTIEGELEAEKQPANPQNVLLAIARTGLG